MTFIKESIAVLNYRGQLSPDGRQRISSQILAGDYKQHNDAAEGNFNTETINGGAFVYENSAVGGTELQVTTTNDAVIRQTYQWHNYFAGKPLKAEFTASYFQPQTDVIKRMGYFSSNTTTPFDSNKDGMYFESSGGTVHCKVLRNGTEVFSQAQGSWLNQNELGSYDPADFNFYVIDFLYLGGAVVNFWVLTEFGLTKIASYQHINVDQNTFVKSPNQPIRYEIRSTGGAGVFNHICSDVVVEGFDNNVGLVRSFNNGTTTVDVASTGVRYALLGVRQGANNRNTVLDFIDVDVLSTTPDNLLVELIYGGSTATPAIWNPLSSVDVFDGNDLAAPADRVHTGGDIIMSAYVVGDGTLSKTVNSVRRIGSLIDGTREEAYVCITSLGANADVVVALNWTEFI